MKKLEIQQAGEDQMDVDELAIQGGEDAKASQEPKF